MSLLIPPAKNYVAPLVSVPSPLLRVPKEGNKQIAVEVDWATMGGSGNCVNFNFSNNSTIEFSQICSLKVDNSQCGSDIQFIFPDTTDTVTIPAYSPSVVVPVFTHAQQFFCVALAEEPQDITRFQILNYLPPPIAVPTSTAQNISSNGGIVLAQSTTQVVPASMSGTLQAIQFGVSVVNASSLWNKNITLVDGGGTTLFTTDVGGPAAGNVIEQIANFAPVNIRFKNGISMVIGPGFDPGGGQAYINFNLAYRTP